MANFVFGAVALLNAPKTWNLLNTCKMNLLGATTNEMTTTNTTSVRYGYLKLRIALVTEVSTMNDNAVLINSFIILSLRILLPMLGELTIYHLN